mmetsp:Transcript_23695/g.50221  ORF Transcript_23695/g.50221 Transcript_23695/m.50221 type:complete len:92 (-) Transcript_23695:206-481(-)
MRNCVDNQSSSLRQPRYRTCITTSCGPSYTALLILLSKSTPRAEHICRYLSELTSTWLQLRRTRLAHFLTFTGIAAWAREEYACYFIERCP